jgi:hypothetical protein
MKKKEKEEKEKEMEQKWTKEHLTVKDGYSKS